jgi:uncharacterized protein (TIGR04255 family)
MTTDPMLPLAHPPIVEAVVDIDCDLPVGLDFEGLEERARRELANDYPIRTTLLQEHSDEQGHAGLGSYQFSTSDGRQLVQIRRAGFSFNRLAPYSSLDDYLPEIERLWHLFAGLVSPIQTRRIGLRYINRLLLPTDGGVVDLDEYLRLGPRLPDEETMRLVGFFNQHSAVEVKTKHHVKIWMLMQPLEGVRLPMIFDIEAMHFAVEEPQAWQNIRATILSLRRLKNDVFQKTLTERCLTLFR